MTAIRKAFEDERRFWILATVVLGSIAVIRAAGWPNTWIATQAQVSYDHGFVKRGLFGELFTKPLHLYTLGRFALVSYALTVVCLSVLILFTFRSGLQTRFTDAALATLFFSSYGLTYFVHDIGYLDPLLIALGVTLLLVRSDVLRLVFGIPVCLFGLLLHEMFLLAVVPVVLFSFLISFEVANSSRQRSLTVIAGGALGLFATVVTIAIARQPTLGPSQLAGLITEIQTRAQFHVEANFFDVLTRSLSDNLRLMETFYYRSADWWLSQLTSVILFGPTVLLLWFGIRAVTKSAGLEHRRALRWGAAIASLSPLSMHAVGFDAVRWSSLVCITTFLVLATLCYRTRGEQVRLSRGWKNCCILAIALNLSSGGSQITGRMIPYPFINDPGFFRSVTTLFKGEGPQTLPR